MKINVVYLSRCIEGKLPSEESLIRQAMEDAYEESIEYADETSNPNDMGDDWNAAVESAYERNIKSMQDKVERLKHKIVWQIEQGCSCCGHQTGAYYPGEWEYHNSWIDNYGSCEACAVGCCEVVRDHSQHLTRNSF